jgi:3-dehydroquinate synthase
MTAPVSPYGAISSGKIVPIRFAPAQSQSYDIVIGDHVLAEAGNLIRAQLGTRRCIVVTDTTVAPLYRARLEAVLATAGHTLMPAIIIPAGESHKNFNTLQSLLKDMLDAGIDRKSLVVALGGGVVGDLAGLAASLVLRGVDCVQIPTTLLAQVDSSVGGKTGIDTAQGKNMVGTFSQPRLVIADMSLLDSLPARDLRAGYAEIVKYGLIMDRPFFEWCTKYADRLLQGDREAQIQAVAASCGFKAKIVGADEKEAGDRALLNLGHTFGHALEAALGFHDMLRHGEAVAIGMVLAFQLSARLNLCAQQEVETVRAHLDRAGLPVSPPRFDWDIDRLMAFMAQDKKAEAGQLTLILARGIGQAFVSKDVRPEVVRDIWVEAVRG